MAKKEAILFKSELEAKNEKREERRVGRVLSFSRRDVELHTHSRHCIGYLSSAATPTTSML